MEGWRAVKTKAGSKIFNSFFLGYKTSKDVSEEVYNKKIIPEVLKYTKLFQQYGYLDKTEGYKVVERYRGRRRIKFKDKEKMQKYSMKVEVYRANLKPFFEWLDDETERILNEHEELAKTTNLKILNENKEAHKETILDMKELLKQYLTRLFETLDKNGISRSRLMVDKDSDIITNMKYLIFMIQRLVWENQGHGGRKFWKQRHGEARFYTQKRDGMLIELPNPIDIFRLENEFMRNFLDSILFPSLNISTQLFPVSPSMEKYLIKYEEKPYHLVGEASKKMLEMTEILRKEELKEALKK